MAPSYPESGIDLYVGIGGAPEAVLAAAGIKCLGGEMQCQMWPRDEKERQKLIDEGHRDNLDRIFFADDLANGQNIIFAATGISDSPLLRGVTRGTSGAKALPAPKSQISVRVADEPEADEQPARLAGAMPALEYEQRIGQARRLVGENSRQVAQVVRNWVSEDGN